MTTRATFSPSSVSALPSRSRIPLITLALIATLLSACAPITRVILLPQADEQPSAVVVTSPKGEQLIDQPYQVIEITRSGSLSVDQTTEEEVLKRYPHLMAMQPPEPASFTLEFEPGTPTLTADSQELMSELIERARARAGGEIVITGYTDRQGSVEDNDKLSLERAIAVRALMIEGGFRPELIEAVGRGEREPLVPTEDEVAEPRNRRVVMQVR